MSGKITGKDYKTIFQNLRNGEYAPFIHKILRITSKYRDYHPDKPVPERTDWDVLVILDACRPDYFQEVNWLPGELETRVSRGSTSIEFLNKEFPEDYYPDIVYVSSNPNTADIEQGYVETFDQSKIGNLVELYLEDDPRETWKMTPEYVLERAQEIIKENPGKRVVVHVMSPHAPYIGEISPDEKHVSPQEYADAGYTKAEIRGFYRSDLRRALKAVEEFLTGLENRENVVVTADHGELLGEYFIYNHPYGVHVPELVRVPWFKVDMDAPDSKVKS